jgi:hypothetical protein
MVESWALDAVVPHMAELENLSFAPAPAMFGLVREVTAAAAGFVAVVGDGGLVPCNVAPILSSRSGGCRLPCQRKPWESCREECLHSMMSSACLARSFFALVAVTLVESSPPLAFVYLLRP